MNTIRIARLRPEAVLPTRKHPQDAGLDLYAAQAAIIAPHTSAIVPTGITLEIPAGFVGLVKPKGRNDHLLGAGVVDAGYQGEILVKVANIRGEALEIHAGEAIGQMVIVPVETPQVEEVSQAEIHRRATRRGGAGGIVDQYQP